MSIIADHEFVYNCVECSYHVVVRTRIVPLICPVCDNFLTEKELRYGEYIENDEYEDY